MNSKVMEGYIFKTTFMLKSVWHIHLCTDFDEHLYANIMKTQISYKMRYYRKGHFYFIFIFLFSDHLA